VLTAINLLTATIIFFPFFKLYDKRQLELEKQEEAAG
jgi:cellobiose-specific phosphotransferase system component IIC